MNTDNKLTTWNNKIETIYAISDIMRFISVEKLVNRLPNLYYSSYKLLLSLEQQKNADKIFFIKFILLPKILPTSDINVACRRTKTELHCVKWRTYTIILMYTILVLFFFLFRLSSLLYNKMEKRIYSSNIQWTYSQLPQQFLHCWLSTEIDMYTLCIFYFSYLPLVQHNQLYRCSNTIYFHERRKHILKMLMKWNITLFQFNAISIKNNFQLRRWRRKRH